MRVFAYLRTGRVEGGKAFLWIMFFWGRSAFGEKKIKRWCRKIEIMMEKSEKSPARGVFDEVPATRREQREPFCIHQKSKLIKTKDATILFCLCPRARGANVFLAASVCVRMMCKGRAFFRCLQRKSAARCCKWTMVQLLPLPRLGLPVVTAPALSSRP